MNIDSMSSTAPLRRFFNATLLSHPAHAAQLVGTLPEVTVNLVVNGVEVSVHSVMQALFAEHEANVARISVLEGAVAEAQRRQQVAATMATTATPPAPDRPATPETAAGAMTTLETELSRRFGNGRSTRATTVGAYVVIGANKYERLGLAIRNYSQAQDEANNTLRAQLVGLQRNVMSTLHVPPATEAAQMQLTAFAGQVADVFGGRE